MHDYSLHSCIDLTSMVSSVSSTHHMPYDKYFTITIPEGSGPSPSHIYSTREPFIVIAIYSTWLQSAASSNPSYLFPAITILERAAAVHTMDKDMKAMLWLELQWCHMSVMVSNMTGNSMCVQTFVPANNREKTEAGHYLSFVRRFHGWLVDSPNKEPIMWKVVMLSRNFVLISVASFTNMV